MRSNRDLIGILQGTHRHQIRTASCQLRVTSLLTHTKKIVIVQLVNIPLQFRCRCFKMTGKVLN